jgi:hypothetical protein
MKEGKGREEGEGRKEGEGREEGEGRKEGKKDKEERKEDLRRKDGREKGGAKEQDLFDGLFESPAAPRLKVATGSMVSFHSLPSFCMWSTLSISI